MWRHLKLVDLILWGIGAIVGNGDFHGYGNYGDLCWSSSRSIVISPCVTSLPCFLCRVCLLEFPHGGSFIFTLFRGFWLMAGWLTIDGIYDSHQVWLLVGLPKMVAGRFRLPKALNGTFCPQAGNPASIFANFWSFF